MKDTHDSRTDKETRKVPENGRGKTFKAAGANVVGSRLPKDGAPKGMKMTKRY